MQTVEDYNGNLIDIEQSVSIGNKFYHFEDVVLINGTFYPRTSLELVIDQSTGKLGLKKHLFKVIDGVDLNNNPTYRYHSQVFDFIECYGGDHEPPYYIESKETALKFEFEEGLGSGVFYLKEHKNKDFQKEFRTFNAIKEVLDSKLDNIRNGVESLTYLITEGKRYTMGLEFETSLGYFPPYLDQSLNVKCVRDGSIASGEYVTGILKGDSGFYQLQKLCVELTKRCKIDLRGGLHVHLGGINFNKEFVVAAYLLALQLETSIFDMLPPSRQHNQFCCVLDRRKVKSDLVYKTESLEEFKSMIGSAYNHIFSFVSTTSEFPNERYHKSKQHPIGPRCGYAQQSPRYNWINFVPAMFNTRENESYSLEFRCHSATLNYIKTSNWVKICMAFVYYAETHANEVFKASINKTPLSLKDILIAAYPKSSSKLIEYVSSRIHKFSGPKAIDNESTEYIKERSDRVKDLTLKQTIECV